MPQTGIDGTRGRYSGGCGPNSARARAVADYLAAAGVPLDKVIVRDQNRREEVHRPSVYVSEGRDSDLSSDEFSRYVTALNRLEADSPSNRFACADIEWSETVDTAVYVRYAYIDAEMNNPPRTPAEAGRRGFPPSAIEDVPVTMSTETDDTPEEPDDAQLTTDDTTGHLKHLDVAQVTQTHYAVYDSETNDVYTVDMGADTNGVRDKLTNTALEDEEKARQVYGAVIVAAADTRQAPQEHLELTVNAGGNSGTGSGGGTQDGSTGSDQSESSTEFDANGWGGDSDQKEAIEGWLESYADFNSDLDLSAVSVEAGTYNGMKGFKLETNPFQCGDKYYGDDDWNDREAWDDVTDAFSSLMQDTDEVIYDADADYLNFLPSENVGDVTE